MSYPDVLRFTSALLQLGVACYALRLGRLFNAARIGWLLFSALSLLAVVYVLLPFNPFRGSVQLALKVDLVYALISVLMLIGMAFLDGRLKHQNRASGEATEQKADPSAQAEWEARVQAQVLDLTQNNEQLQQTIASLQNEVIQQKQAQELAETNFQEQLAAAQLAQAELQQSESALRASESALRQSVAPLEKQISEFKAIQEKAEQVHQDQLLTFQDRVNALEKEVTAYQAQLESTHRLEEALRGSLGHLQNKLHEQQRVLQDAEVSRRDQLALSLQTGRSEAVARVVPQLDSLLDRLDALGDDSKTLADSNFARVTRIGELLREAPRDRKAGLKGGTWATQVQNSLRRFARQLSHEQTNLSRRIDSLRRKVELVKKSVATRMSPPAPVESTETVASTVEPVEVMSSSQVEQPFEAAETTAMPETAPLVDQEPPPPPATSLPPPAGFEQHLITTTTETGTEISPAEPAPAPEERTGPLILGPQTTLGKQLA